ncbi:MAG: Gfo/Idh/MocA family oxidoreductase [Chloroflexi bacterium]|nr:Gfo/Idh/MocA family oxidoreductase [Chloroflexota bacterium]
MFTPLKNKPLKFAVLGTGIWSQFQIPAWFEVGGVELVALYNRTVAKAELVARKYNTPKVYADPDELFRSELLDFVDIITEVPAHASLVLLAAKYHIPVICQKPMGPDYETCVAMVQACQEAGIPFFIHENFRWQWHYRAVRHALDERHLGRLHRADIRAGNGGKTVLSFQPVLRTLPHRAITDMGSHIFDLARFYFGEPESIYCHARRTFDGVAGEDVMAAMLRFPDLVCTCAISERPNFRVFIEGEYGTIEVGNDRIIHITTDKGTILRQPPEMPRYPWVTPEQDIQYGRHMIQNIVECNKHFYHALITGNLPETHAGDNLKTMRLVYAACESTERNAVIELS